MEKIAEQVIPIFRMLPLIKQQTFSHIWIDYDREADVLYINFDKTKRATDSILTNDVLVRKCRNQVIGVTFLNASKIKI